MRQKSIHLIMRRLWTQATAAAAATTTKVGVLVAQEPRPSPKLLASRFCVSPCFLSSKIHSWQQQQIMSHRERERERAIDFFHSLDTKFFSARSILQWEEEAADEEEADQFAVTKLNANPVLGFAATSSSSTTAMLILFCFS